MTVSGVCNGTLTPHTGRKEAWALARAQADVVLAHCYIMDTGLRAGIPYCRQGPVYPSGTYILTYILYILGYACLRYTLGYACIRVKNKVPLGTVRYRKVPDTAVTYRTSVYTPVQYVTVG